MSKDSLDEQALIILKSIQYILAIFSYLICHDNCCSKNIVRILKDYYNGGLSKKTPEGFAKSPCSKIYYRFTAHFIVRRKQTI